MKSPLNVVAIVLLCLLALWLLPSLFHLVQSLLGMAMGLLSLAIVVLAVIFVIGLIRRLMRI